MEGTLLKWTNYYNGWQPRYFILNEQGVLSYYKSKDLIDQGCKGSCAVAVCQLKVNVNDCCRFDLIIPGEQFFCLKAKNQSERQNWLLAIGTLQNGQKKVSKHRHLSSERKSTISNSNEIDQELKIKIQELRLYEAVLTQGIHHVKSLANDSPILDVEKLDQSTSMLTVTCDAFIHTLDECFKLANGNSFTSSSTMCSIPSSSSSSQINTNNKEENLSSDRSTCSTMKSNSELSYRTMFSEISSTFDQFQSIRFDEILSQLFIQICLHYFSIFEKCPSPTFIPLKTDIQSNISKIQRKIQNDPRKFEYLRSIIEDDLILENHKEKNSATDAILWLKRNLEFLSCFLDEFGQGSQTVEDSLNKAYLKTLRIYHGWITRGIFSIAFRSSPMNDDFLHSLIVQDQSSPMKNNDDDRLRKQIFSEMIEHSKKLNEFLVKINDFYVKNKLDSNEIIG